MWRRIEDVFLFGIMLTMAIGTEALVNLARDKPANMSTTYGSYVAGNAVDGNTTQTRGSGSCSSTYPDAYDPAAWWRVDLEKEFNIHTIKIYFRDEGTLYRSRGVDVYVTNTTDVTSSTPCYEGPDSVPPPVVTVETCKRIGRYVTVYKHRLTCNPPYINKEFCSILELCEVEVLGCLYGKYGNMCEHDCPSQCKNGLCNIITGHCINGCNDGYKGLMCNSTCEPGFYGYECTLTCGNCKDNNSCDYVTGNCTEGCSDGWTGYICKRQCNSGFYGPNCVHECQNCINRKCHPVDGNCTTGCKIGWTGDYCQSKVKCNIGEIDIVNSEMLGAVHDEVEMNESVTMKCKKGYNQTGGDTIRTCTKSGTWSGQTLNCSICKCPCRNPILPNDTEALAAWMKQMREDLTWDPKNTSKFRRTKISADDNNRVSKTIGVTLGIGVLSFVAAIICLPDIPRLVRDLGCKKRYHKVD